MSVMLHVQSMHLLLCLLPQVQAFITTALNMCIGLYMSTYACTITTHMLRLCMFAVLYLRDT